MSFIEENLLEELSYGFNGGPTWDTRRVGLRNGIIRRNVTRTRPLHRFAGSFDLRNEETLHALVSTFNACRGGAYGFRFRNPTDYKVQSEQIAVAAGGEETIQLTKSYTFGTETLTVPIRKPRAEGFELLVDGLPTTTVLDSTTGMVTYTASAGDIVTWSGVFDLPVMFLSDDFQGTIVKWSAHTVDVTLEEDLSA